MRAFRRLAFTVGPGVLLLVALVVAPGLLLLGYSLLTRTGLAAVGPPLTLENYLRVLGYDPVFGEWNTDNLRILGRTLWLSVASTALCALLGYPLALFIARADAARKNVLLLLLVIPFWTNFLIRTYAWIVVLGREGPVNSALAAVGLPRLDLYPSTFATFLGLVYTFLPFFVLPVYASAERADPALAEAAQDLGATPTRAFWAAVFPQTVPGLVAGLLLTFIPALGTFVVSDLLGGAKVALIGNLVQNQFGQFGDWPYGSALSALLLAAVLVGLWLYARAAGRRGLEELV